MKLFYGKEQNSTFLKCRFIRISALSDVRLKEFCCILEILMLTYSFTYTFHHEDEERQRHGGEVLGRQYQHVLI